MKFKYFFQVKLMLIITLGLCSDYFLYASSLGRVPSRLTTRWSPPSREDFDDYVKKLNFKIRKEFNNKLKEEIRRVKDVSDIKKLLDREQISKASKASLLIKLADIYTEQARNSRNKILKKYDKLYNNWLDQEVILISEEPTLKLDKTHVFIKKAIKTYRRIFDEIPKFRSDPEFQYKIGQYQLTIGNPNAELYFNKVLKEKPNSKWGSWSLLGLGEYYYNNREYNKAKKFYIKSKKSKLREVRYYARYKLAWIRLLKNKQDESINARAIAPSVKNLMKLAVSGLGSDKSKFKGASKFLQIEAQKDLVWVWSESNKIKNAKSLFVKKIKKNQLYIKSIERLGWVYRRKNQALLAAKSYRKAIQLNPSNSSRMRIHFWLIDLLYKSKNPIEVMNEAISMVDAYANKNSAWMLKNKGNSGLIKMIDGRILKILTKISSHYYKEYKKNNDKAYLKSTNMLYRLFLKIYKDTIQAYDIRFHFAETEEYIGRRSNAVRNYHVIVKSKKKKLTHHREIASERMVALQIQIVKAKKYPNLGKDALIKKPIKIEKEKTILASVIDTFLKYFPRNKSSNERRFLAANIYYDYGHYQKSTERFFATVKNGSGTKEGRSSTQIILNMFAIQKKWFSLRDWSEKLLKFSESLGEEIRKFIIKKLTLGMWNIAANYEKAKKYKKSIVAFLAFQKRLPEDKNADKSLYKAIMINYKIGNGLEGIKISKKIIKIYPKTTFGNDVIYNMANTYENLNQFRNSAETFEKFEKEYPNDKRASVSLYKSAHIYEGLKNLDRCALILGYLVDRHQKSNLAPKALIEKADIELKLDFIDKAEDSYRQYIERYKSLDKDETLYATTQSVVLSMDLSVPSYDKKDIQNIENQLIKLNKKKGVKARKVLVKSFFSLVGKLTNEFSNQKVSYYDFNQYETSISNYLKMVKEIEGLLYRVLKFANYEDIVQAHFLLAKVYDVVVNSFEETWKMDGLSNEETDDILNSKERQALIYREKQESSLEKCYQEAVKYKILNKYRSEALDKLSLLKPTKYKKIKEDISSP